MEPQETKFTFVYNEIKQCILDGQILPGNSLLSSRMYCEKYHVSRYTINHVFDALEEGLIEIQPRLALSLFPERYAGFVEYCCRYFEAKETILQVYQTFALILPPFLFLPAGCDVGDNATIKTGAKKCCVWAVLPADGVSSSTWDMIY